MVGVMPFLHNYGLSNAIPTQLWLEECHSFTIMVKGMQFCHKYGGLTIKIKQGQFKPFFVKKSSAHLSLVA